MHRNLVGGGLDVPKNLTLSNSPSKVREDTIKNKRVFIENTVDSILQTKTSKIGSFMPKPVGAMSGTGTTDVNPKVHSVSPRGNVGSSVGLANISLGGLQTTNITKVNNVLSGGASPTKKD
jgi:hypothetical protein